MQCSGFIEILDMTISDPTELKTYWIWSNSKHSIKYTHLAISFLLAVSPQNSPQQSATAEGFAEANSVFIVITLAYSESRHTQNQRYIQNPATSKTLAHSEPKTSTSNKKFACTGQLILFSLIQAIKLPSTVVT